ncbi:MAG: T9SS type A sorting domain-containing protein [Vicingaceae bacterium]
MYISLIAIFLFGNITAQTDTLYELGLNGVQNAFYNTNKSNPNSPYTKNKKQNKALLSIPFVDDFSQNYLFPNQNLWEDLDVFVNSNYPINPVTYGVATFDGLDSTGTPYNFSFPNSYGQADKLTSQPIDLTTVTDSVFLSFYYQPQGNGNKPEAKDSLRLEFFRQRDSTWIRMWGTPGAPNHTFKKVMIPVDTSFHNNEFQFRFTNWATLSGNVDHWHVDYIYLNDNRTHADTMLHDVSFITNHFNLLKNYTAMPWDHYHTNATGNMAATLPVTYRNNDTLNYQVRYKYEVIEDNGNGASIELYPAGPANKNVAPYNSLTEPHAVFSSPLNNFSFPADNSVSNKVFQIKNYFELFGSPQDDRVINDTVLSYQAFGSYYAYDDGSAEQGYGVQGIGSKLANEFTIQKTDTLTAFQIYFNPIQNDLSGQSFRLKVWSSLSPETEVYSQASTAFTSPIYSGTNQFLIYNLDQAIVLPAGTYYFGWEKISAQHLNVGWDVNTNTKTKVHFNSSGAWQNASFDGSLMLRPVFGTTADPVVSIEETKSINELVVYPNPATNNIYFNNDNYIPYNVQLIDIYGKIIINLSAVTTNQIDVTTIANGMYIIRFTNNNTKESTLKKVIISK